MYDFNIQDKEINTLENSVTINYIEKAETTPMPAPTIENINTIAKEEIDEFFITKSGRKYHIENCYYLKESAIPIRLDNAIQNDYTACKVCIK